MQSDNRLFDDFVKLMNGRRRHARGVGREAESGARAGCANGSAGSISSAATS